ncbi:rCG38096, partial [Rattus norvegicus]
MLFCYLSHKNIHSEQ